MTKPSIQDIAARLASGEALSDVLASFISPAERALQRRAALVRALDKPTFDLLRATVEESTEAVPDFESFVKTAPVEPVPGVAGQYRLRDRDRRELLKNWSGTSEFQQLNGTLASFYRQQGAHARLDVLYHLAAAQPAAQDQARQQFVQLFDEADARFDLARCADLIDVVRERRHLLDAAFIQVLNEKQHRLQARRLWSEEFYRTTCYFNRPHLADAISKLTTDGSEWILQVYATGGMGKTMFLSWAIARYAGGQRIPCARLDFDFEDPRLLNEQTWRFVLKIARQLNEQMEGSPFTRLIKDYTDIEGVEEVPDEVASAAGAASRHERHNREAFERFTSSLREIPSPAPVLLFFDTLEQVVLHYPEALYRLVERLESVHASYPPLRLVLAGRYNVEDRDRLPSYKACYGDVTNSIVVKPFAVEEGRTYLTVSRGLPDDDRIDAIVSRSDGVPFKLSLFATLVQSDPSLDATAIRSLPDVNVEYLIKRVVDRISDPVVRWVIRYGVVPRRLTRTFLFEVMRPHLLEAAARGGSELDDGKDDLPERLHKDDRFTKAEKQIDFDELWRTISQYAADYGWIGVSKEWSDTLVFHGDVVNPMRRLLQRKRVFKALHVLAADYYDTKSEAEPQYWVRWKREAIYHRFQAEGSGAEAVWRATLRQADEPSRRREIAEEVLGSEYVDETGTPQERWDGTPMVSAILGEANYEAARAGMEEARSRRLPSTDQRWLTAERRLKEAERLQATAGAPVPVQYLLLKARLEANRNHTAAIATLDRMRPLVQAEDRGEYEELYGDAVAQRSFAEALPHYRTALLAIARGPAARIAEVAGKLSDAAEEQDIYDEAVEAAQRALNAAESTKDPAAVALARLRLADALLAAGQPRPASAVCRRSTKEVDLDEDARASLAARDVQALIALGEPLEALRLARRQFRDVFREDAQAGPATIRRALGLELQGDLQDVFFEPAAAVHAWQQARESWDELGRPSASFRCALRSALVLLRMEDFPAADQLISEAERTATLVGNEAVLGVGRLEILRQAAAGQQLPKAQLDGLLDSMRHATDQPPRVVIATGRLAVQVGHRRAEAAHMIGEALARVSPPLARLVTLRPAAHLPNAPVDDRALAKALLPAATAAERQGGGLERVVLEALAARYWVGQSAEARASIGKSRKRLGEARSLYGLIELRALADRFKIRPGPPLYTDRLRSQFLAEFRELPRVCGMFLLAEAETLHSSGQKITEKTINEIHRLLGSQAQLPAPWRARLEKLRAAGAPRATRATPERTTGGLAPPSISFQNDAPTVHVRINKDGHRTLSMDGKTVHSGSRLDPALARLLGGDMKVLTGSGQVVPYDFVKRFLLDPVAVASELGSLLRGTPLPGGAADVRLELAHALVGSLPWELAFTEAQSTLGNASNIRVYRSSPDEVALHERVRWLQTALNLVLPASLQTDGVFGPQTAQAVRAFKRAKGLASDDALDPTTRKALADSWRASLKAERARVVVVRRSVRAQEAEAVGDVIWGFDVARTYDEHGWEETTLEDPERGDLLKALGARRPGVLHLCGAFGESATAGGVYLDVGRDTNAPRSRESMRRVRRSVGISVSALAEAVGKLGAEAPVVILDPPSAGQQTETVRQILLRNAFASDLISHGVTPGIVAAGLAEAGASRILTTTIVNGLTNEETLHSICRQARGTGRAQLPRGHQTDWSAAATALFTNDPGYIAPRGFAATGRYAV